MFYTDGVSLWNADHEIVPGDYQLRGSQNINANSIFVPFPENDSLYLLFTIGKQEDSLNLYYHLINSNLNNYKGGIVYGKMLHKQVMNRITGYFNCNSGSYRIITQSADTALFYTYEIDLYGLDTNCIRSIAPGNLLPNIGYMKASPNGKKLLVPVNKANILASVYDIDSESGQLSKLFDLYRKNLTYAFGCEFSPDGRFLYISTGGENYELLQFDLSSKNEIKVNESKTKITEGNVYGLQLSIDGKIYINCLNTPFLHVIHQPWKKGPDCEYESKAIELKGGTSQMGLPVFIQTWFYKPLFRMNGFCLGDTTDFQYETVIDHDSLLWKIFGSNGEIVSYKNKWKFSHIFEDTGRYHASLEVYHCQYTFRSEENFLIHPIPQINLFTDTMVYTGQFEITLNASYDSIYWWIGSFGNTVELPVPGEYGVTVYKNACQASREFRLDFKGSQVFFPTAFSPNNDGVNDVFKPVVSGQIDCYQLLIFSRNGTQVFESNNIQDGWDGNMNGHIGKNNTYCWIARYCIDDGRERNKEMVKKGVVYLSR